MLVVLINMGSPEVSQDKKFFELRIPQNNKGTFEEYAKTFKFSLPVIFMDTRCEPSKGKEDPSILSI
jgi:hypothetical protein